MTWLRSAASARSKPHPHRLVALLTPHHLRLLWLREGLRHYVPLGFPHADVAQLRHRLTEAMRRLEVALVNRLAEAG
ncbi:hypothetical protein, partial [Calidithermus roseus]|uniref:hypothetical protein n=1 Tax=Calidithermus roseus TaxID=1644118 RepID=UPI0011C46679